MDLKGGRLFGEKAYPTEGERNGSAKMEGGQEEEREAMIEEERGEHFGMLDERMREGAAGNVQLPHRIILRRGHCEQPCRPS